MSEESEPTIRLDQFLKLMHAVNSGGEAKHRIQGGEVQLNGEVETRRSRKLHRGDVVSLAGQSWTVQLAGPSGEA